MILAMILAQTLAAGVPDVPAGPEAPVAEASSVVGDGAAAPVSDAGGPAADGGAAGLAAAARATPAARWMLAGKVALVGSSAWAAALVAV